MFVYDSIKSARGTETSAFHSISLLLRLGMYSSLPYLPLREIQLFFVFVCLFFNQRGHCTNWRIKEHSVGMIWGFLVCLNLIQRKNKEALSISASSDEAAPVWD